MAGFVLVAWFYAWTACPTPDSWRVSGQQSDHYNLLLHGLLKGHLYMDVPVSEELKNCPNPWDPSARPPGCPIVQDASYYNGHYYLYYGAAPLVTLMLPFRLVTGNDMPLPLAILAFACAGLLASLVLWESIRERYFPAVRAWVGAGAVLILGVANPLPVLIRRTQFYELPITSAYCFVMFALLALYLSIHSKRPRGAWLAVASLCLGLAVASRPTFLFATPILLLPPFLWWREGPPKRGIASLPVRGLAAAVIPLVAIGALMAAYNYMRFGRFGEFGTNYQVAAGYYLTKMRLFSVAYVPFNFFAYFLSTPDFSRHFPYLLFPAAYDFPVRPPSDYYGLELVVGLLACFPICWFAVLSIFAGTDETHSKRGALLAWLLCAWGVFAASATVLLVFHAGIIRYMFDFTPALMLCAAVGLLVLERWLRRRRAAVRILGRIAWIGALAVSLFASLMFSLDVHGTFRNKDPEGHARVAQFFSRFSFWNKRLPDEPAGPIEITLRFDQPAAARIEPVLACGWGDNSEHVFLRCPDAGHVVVGHRWGFLPEDQLSQPIPIHAGEVHRLYLDLGSLYSRPKEQAGGAGPPQAAGSEAVDRLKKRWAIFFDGDPVVQGQYDYGAGAPFGDPSFLGFDPNSDLFGRELATRIISVKRLTIAEAAAKGANRCSMGLEFLAPRDRAEGSATVLAVEGSGAGLRAEIDYLDKDRADLRIAASGRDLAHSEVFPNS
ncbi:MAG: hypothetical protein ABSA05_16020, partial [Opitutaceae bacterium]